MDQALDPARWRRLSAILDGALDLPLDAREPYLQEVCGNDADLRRQVEELLAADASAGRFLETPAGERVAPLVAEMSQGLYNTEGFPKGRIVGTYRLLDELGEGGMGTVHLAERADGQFEQKVAIKLLRHGLESREARRRFLQERQILARLQHPAIARLLDGGVTEQGVPFFVMELVEGQPVTTYCEERRLGIESRLRVFLEVCDAAQYAHRNLVVHRDLKPSNVLVSPGGTVKLLDFGIAKLLEDSTDATPAATRTLLQAMTPEYAAPEQVRGDAVTTATDVYALGVLLYEVLTSSRPYRVSGGTLAELERAILEEEPMRPSARLRGLRGDLDGIVLKALQKEPERRYPSADALANDIRRHLQGLPVSARGDTLAYRARKFVRRHRLGVSVAALLVLSLLAGLAGTISQARRAQREARKAEAVKDFLKSLFAASDPAESKGRERTARELLEAGAGRIGTELQDQPEVQSEVARLIGDVYFQLGDYERALPILREDLERRRRMDGPRSVAVAESLTRIADVTYDSGQFDEAAALYESALAIQREKRGERSAEVAELLWDLAGVRRNRDDLAGAEDLDRQSLSIFIETKGDDSKEAVGVRESLAIVYARGERLAEATALQEQVAAWRERHYGPDHPHTLNARYNLASYLLSLGRLAEARGIAEDVVARQRRVMGERHDRLGVSLRVLARALDGQGYAEAALPRIAEALSIHRDRFGPAHYQVAMDLAWQGMIEAHTHRLTEAVDHSLQAIALLGAEKTVTPRDLATARLYAGIVLLEAGRLPEADAELAQAVIPFSDEAGTQLLLGRALDAQGDLARRRNQTARAASLGRQAVSALERGVGRDSPTIALARVHLGDALWADGHEEEGEALMRAGIERLERDFPAGHPDLASAQCLFGNALATRGRRDEALPLLMSGLAWRQVHLGSADPRTLAVLRALASISSP
jgi:serine/threonine-protein kinase